MKTHTPGPWVDNDSRWPRCVVSPAGYRDSALPLIVVAQHVAPNDARLIKLAPEMLEALRLIARSEGFSGGTWAGELQGIARAVLAKYEEGTE